MKAAVASRAAVSRGRILPSRPWAQANTKAKMPPIAVL